MFTGIIEEKGKILSCISGNVSGSVKIAAKKIIEDAKTGDSIAVNGVCLTVTGFFEGGFTADVMNETLRCTTLGRLKNGDEVNLERALSPSARIGGHFVTGHVDAVGRITEWRKSGNAIISEIKSDEEITSSIVDKGSVAIDGISLTVVKVSSDKILLSLIPHTIQHTTLSNRKIGDYVNIETDIIGKYVKKMLSRNNPDSGLSMSDVEFLL